MSENDIKKGRVPTASAGMILYKRAPDGLKIVVGERRNDPWKEYAICVFGGSVDGNDENVEQAALREAMEETGGTLRIGKKHLVGCYGPKSIHHKLVIEKGVGLVHLRAEPTTIEVHSHYKFVYVVYAGCVINDAAPRENDEVIKLRFVDPLELTESEKGLAFDQALILADFYYQFLYDPRFLNPQINQWVSTFLD